MKGSLRDNPLVRLALVRPITMLMCFASVLVVGLVAVLNIPLELIPSGFSAPVMSINVPYDDATPQDVEERITLPLEEGIASTPDVDEIISTSGANGSNITLIFDPTADMDIAYREVRDRVDRVRGELPDDVREVNIRKQSGDGIPVAFFGVRWDPSMDDVAQDVVERHLIQKLERVDGVGLVNSWGAQEREIRIEVDRQLAEAANLNIFEIAQKLSASHFNLASGEVTDVDGRFLVRSLASYQTVEDLEAAVVGPNDLRLGDVADVVYDYPELERHDRWNGQKSMALFVVKESQANTVDVCDAVKDAVEEARLDPALQRFEIEKIFVQGDTIRTSLRQVTDSGLQGGILALIVLLFFLRRVRLTMTIALSIPLSMFMSLPFMYFSGQSINLVSLIGLMICIGLVVDNSVVVAENVQRYRTRGVPRMSAALHGASEVALPITLATATTMVVFLPMALISSGTTRFFMIRMVTPVCVSLLSSLFVALIVIPLAAAFLFDRDIYAGAKPGSPRDRLRRFDAAWKRLLGRAYDLTFGKIGELYARVLRFSLRRRVDVILISLFVLASIAVPAMHVSMKTDQGFGGRQVTFSYTIPSDVSLEEADAFFRDLEAWFDAHRDEYNADGQYIQIEPGYASVQVFFEPPERGDLPYIEQGQRIFKELPTPPGWELRSRFSSSDGGKDTALPIAIYGNDHETVQEVREQLETQVAEIEGIISVAGSGRGTSRRDELALTVDRAASERYGVPASMVGNTVAYALRGSPLPRFYTEDRDIEVWIRYEEEDREQLGELLHFKVPSRSGAPMEIGSLVHKEIAKGESQLVRYNKRTADRLLVEIDPDDRQATIERLVMFLSSYELPEGVSFSADQEARALDDQTTDFIFSALLGSLFIFLLMGFLFESIVLPLSVMPSLPLAFVGVWWTLYLTGEGLDGLAVVGVLLLLGVVVNNAIVLIDFINNARAQGLSRTDAVVQAGVQRFRPIFMTALTTVGGMIPLAVADAPPEGIPYNAFGMTLVGGMSTATVLTLVIVPVFYTIFDDLRAFMTAWFARVMKR